jgi:hypothetical protein
MFISTVIANPPAALTADSVSTSAAVRGALAGRMYTPSRRTPHPVLFSSRQTRIRRVELPVGRLVSNAKKGVISLSNTGTWELAPASPLPRVGEADPGRRRGSHIGVDIITF